MAIIKCKMCGGDMELSVDKTFGTCEYCGSVMTLPKLSDEQRTAAFNRGNHFRRIGEFDKALSVYEQIVKEDENDAEAHWCCALCRFGIEYVEDPTTYEWLPTCHRASFDSILEDVDYLAAVEHSDGITRRQYQKDAAKIAEVQRGILATSQTEEPFDVFICYKETDAQGERTVDSTLAQDIYYQLTEQGLRVFFARITLEDKVGSEYEPYIFAALNSAKAMIVVGTDPAHFNAVWVKNEWSRYLVQVKKNRQKLLIPCYRDMNPYDLPEQLAVLQSYDMSKIGFMQDLIRGIKKVVGVEEPTPVRETVVVQNESSTAPLLKRASIFLEDKEWDKADEYAEKVLDLDPECAEAYLTKLLAELNACTIKDLEKQSVPFDENYYFSKAMRFGNEELKGHLKHYSDVVKRQIESEKERIRKQQAEESERQRKETLYVEAMELISNGDSESLQSAIAKLKSISGWKDSDQIVDKYELRLRIERRYCEYQNTYPLIKEINEIEAERNLLLFQLSNTKIGKKQFPVVLYVLGALSLLWFYGAIESIGSGLGAVALAFARAAIIIVATLFAYQFSLINNRLNIAGAISDCDKKIEDYGRIPQFLEYAPELSSEKEMVSSVLENYDRDEGQAASRAWQRECDIIETKRNIAAKEELERANNSHQNALKALDSEVDTRQAEIQNLVSQFEKEKMELTSEYLTLGTLQVSRKEAIKKRTTQIKEKLQQLSTSAQSIKQYDIKKRKEIEVAYQASMSSIKRKYETEYPMPKEPVSIQVVNAKEAANLNVLEWKKKRSQKNGRANDKKLQAYMRVYMQTKINPVRGFNGKII